jgi:hypothetical protein
MPTVSWKMGAGLGLTLVLGGTAPASAEAPAPAPAVQAARGADSAFFIARGKNRNQVHYGVRVGPDCKPEGAQPVHAYWRMLEKGEGVTEPLLGIEGPAYGLKDSQQVEALPGGAGWRVRIWLRAHPDRPIDVSVLKEGGRCVTRAAMKMGDAVAQIDRIFVKDKWPAGVDFVMLSGVGADGKSVREVIRP